MIRLCGAITGWLTLAFIAFVTLSPVQDRPSIANPQTEHFAAFAVMALGFALGYPRRTTLIVIFIVCSAFTLEAMQLLTPDRHGRLLDAAVKMVGGLAGIGAGRLIMLVLHSQFARLRSPAKHSPS